MRTRSMRFGSMSLVGFLAALFVATSPARAGFVELQTGFTTTAGLSYSFDTFTRVGTLTVELTNTTQGFGDDGGIITNLLFRIDGNATASLASVSLPSGPNPNWADARPNATMKPFGMLEAGASITGDPSQSGIDVNTPGTFVFEVTGTDASSLTESSFFTGDGLTDDGFSDVPMVVPFRGIGPGYRADTHDDDDDGGGLFGDGDDGGDDVGFGSPPMVPLPSALPMGLAGLVGVLVLRWMRRPSI